MGERNHTYKKIRLYLVENTGIMEITLANPPVNALTLHMRNELGEALKWAEYSSDVELVVIRNEGKYFSAGADIHEIYPIAISKDFRAAYRFSKEGQDLMRYIKNFPKEVTAIIDGYAFGGGFELALACHQIIATHRSIIGLPEVTLGLIPGWGGTVHLLSRTYNEAYSHERILKGDFILGEEAYEYNFVDEIDSRVQSEQITLPPHRPPSPRSQLLLKQFLFEGGKYNEEEMFEREAITFAFVCTQEDAREGITAFLEKRLPIFKPCD